MAYNKIIGPSTNLQDMDKMAEELKSVHGFISSKDDSTKAADTLKVGSIESEKIAVAALDTEGNLKEGRGTVDNALKLGGKEANEYFSKDEGNALEGIADFLTSNSEKQIADLYDEFYQLKNTLIRAGICKTSDNFKGFCETFITETEGFSNNKYVLDSQPASGIVTSLKLGSSFTDFKEDEYIICIVKNDDNNIVNRFLTSISGTPSPDMGINPTITINPNETVEVYKFLGERKRSSYSFSKETSNTITNKERVTVLNDDKYSKEFKIERPNQGYAMTTFIPSVLEGALNRFVIKGRVNGSPGNLTCYVMKKSDINTFKSIAEAKVANKILATSSPVVSTGSGTFSDVTFMFNPEANNFLSLDTETEYCFVFEVSNADSLNYWEILMTTNGESGIPSDIKTNVGLYMYELVPVGINKDAFTQDLTLQAYDLYYTLGVYEVAPLVETPYTVGLYTVNKSFKEKDYGNRLRVSMSIAKEGDTKVSSSTQTYPVGSSITTSSTVSAIDGLIKDDIVIIGETINTIETVSSGNIILQNEQYIKKDDPIYRIGYKLQAFVKMIDIKNGNAISIEKVDIPLLKVKPLKEVEGFSDRLVFEVDLGKTQDELSSKFASEVELQISWFTRKSEAEIINNQSLIGRIGTIDMSLTKTV